MSLYSAIVVGLSGVEQYTFIGLKDMVGDNRLSSYRWMADNSKMVYSNFNGAEPGSTVQHCIVLNRDASYRWHDTNCDLNYTSLCEGAYVSKTCLGITAII